MRKVRIFLDDVRESPRGWLLFRTGEELIKWLQENKNIEIEIISFDHDLGDENYLNGYETVQQIVDYNPQVFDKIDRITFHTDNLIGMRNMYYYLVNAQKHEVISNHTKINNTKINCINGKFSFSSFKIS